MLNQWVARIKQWLTHAFQSRRQSTSEDKTPLTFFIPPLVHAPIPPRVDGAQSVAHLAYTNTTNPPPRPNLPHTRFICISDTHSQIFDVPLGDVLLHSGDLTSKGKIEDFQVTLDWLCALPHKLKMWVVLLSSQPLVSLMVLWVTVLSLATTIYPYIRIGTNTTTRDSTMTQNRYALLISGFQRC